MTMMMATTTTISIMEKPRAERTREPCAVLPDGNY